MLAFLALAFVVVPMVEIAVLVQVGDALGIWNTLGLLVLVSLVGAWLTRHEGFYVLGRIREQLAAGRIPGNELVDGGLVLAAGLLLLTPGFVTDAVGLLLLFPPTRAPVRGLVRRRLGLRVVYQQRGPGPGGPGGPDDVIDV